MSSGILPHCITFRSIRGAMPRAILYSMRLTRTARLLLALILGVTLAFAPAPGERGSLLALPGIASVIGNGPALGPQPVLKGVSLRVASKAAIHAEDALQALSPFVTHSSHPGALEAAFKAYYNFREANSDQVRTPFLYFVDFGLGNEERRGYVFDMMNLRLIEGPFTVAAGSGSGSDERGVPQEFSNRPGSNATSLGLFVTTETYAFSGKSNGVPYRSIGLRMEGVSDAFNDAAAMRGVVIHGAPYVTPGRAGRSEGCPAMEPERAERLLPMLGTGSLVFMYSPNDRAWAMEEPWTQPELDYLYQIAGR